jgi:hypothetical protein
MWRSGADAAPVRLTSIGGSYILDSAWSAQGNDIAFVGVKEVPLRRGFEDEPAEVAPAEAESRTLATVDASGAPR